MKTPKVTFRLAWMAAAASLLTLSCLRDDGVVEPGDPRLLPVLVRLQGKAAVVKPEAFDLSRLQDLPNPKIALVWEFIGTKVTGTSTFGKVSVDAGSPFKFNIEIDGPPPPAVAESKEPVFGHLWLYSDRDEDGEYQRFYHPDHAALMAKSDSLGQEFAASEKAWLEVAEQLPAPVLVSDTFYLVGMGTLLHQTAGRIDTLFVGRSASDTLAKDDLVYRRIRLLKNYNSWENFFALRKRSHDTHKEITPMADRSVRIIWQDWIRMVPRRGMEAEFERRLQDATNSYLVRFGTLAAINREVVKKGWLDYRYDGYDVAGADWVVGRSRLYHVVYFPDSASMRVALDAERSGAFRVDGLDRLRRGYNVLHCDEQYRCRVLAPGDSILIEQGMHEAYFNPPAAPLEFPVTEYKPRSLTDSTLARMAGGFRYRSYGPVTVLASRGRLWVDLPRLGFHRAVAADSLSFFVPGRDIQYEFVPSPGGDLYKLFVYNRGERSVCLREDSLARTAQASDRVEARLALRPVPLPGPMASMLPAAFLQGADTLRLEAAPEGDSVMWRAKGIPPQPMLALNDSQAFSAYTEDRITLSRNSQGTVTSLWLSRDDGEFLLPRQGYLPRPVRDLFPDGPDVDSMAAVSVSPGSGRDTYVGLAGTKRYACSEDGALLADGDDGARLIRRGGTGDSISMKAAGEGLRLTLKGLAGRWAAIQVRTCGERGPGSRRILASLHGRDSTGRQIPLSDDVWMGISAAGDSLIIGPFPVPSDMYEVELVRRPTLDPDVHFAFDRFRVFAK